MMSIFRRLMPVQGSLGARTLNATVWNLGGTGATFVLRLASNLIMTRLLMPEAFGMLAFAMTFASAVGLLTDIGIRQSIVREKALMGPRFLRVCWTVGIVRSLLISAVVLILAGLFALVGPSIGQPDSVMAKPEMPLLIAMVALVPIIEGLVSTNWSMAVRRLQYQRLVPLEVAGHFVRILFQVGFAIISPTVWALLFGTIVGGLGKVVFSHLFLPGPKMRPVWDREIARSLWGFGKWIMASSGMTFLINNGEKLILGALASSTTLGLLVIAQVWTGALQSVLTMLVASIGFPTVTEVVRDRPQDVRRLIRKFLNVFDALSIVGVLGLVVLGQWLVDTLYTDAYQKAGDYLRLLAPFLLALRFSVLGNVLIAKGDSRSIFVLASLSAVATVAFLIVGFQVGGVEAALTGLVLARFVSTPYLLWRTLPIFGPAQTAYDVLWWGLSIAAAIVVYLMV